MSALSLLSPAALALAFSPLLGAQGGTWRDKPLFDWTNLQPSDEEYWAPLEAAQVTLAGALALVEESEEGMVRPLEAGVRQDREGRNVWQIDVFVGDTPKRVNLQVSMAEPKILKRLELFTLTEADQNAWKTLKDSKVLGSQAIEVAHKSVRGTKEVPIVAEPRVRQLSWTSTAALHVWDLSVMGIDKRGVLRRYMIQVPAERPIARQKILMDRFAGEPLRKDRPRTLDNGLVVFDFIEGDGERIDENSVIRVNYRLFLNDGTLLTDTFDDKVDIVFKLSEAPLQGIAEGLNGVTVGTKRKIVIPHDKAWGEKSTLRIPPRAMITCDIVVEALVGQEQG